MTAPLNATPSANATSDKIQRTSNGRCASGNFSGSGHPFAQKIAFLRTIALEAATEKDFREMFDALQKKAKTGDIAAIQLYDSHTVKRRGQAAAVTKRVFR